MLTEWWTYRPHDFLMFAPRTYWRLFELQNEAWPVLSWVLLDAALLAFLALWWCTRPAASRFSQSVAARYVTPALLTALAAVCAFVALNFIHARYVPINWAAQGLVLLWLLQALLLLALGIASAVAARHGARQGLLFSAPDRSDGPWPRRAALLLGALALLGYPLLPHLSGRPAEQAEWFGLAPDPTVVFTLALLLLLPRAVSRLQRVLLGGIWLAAWLSALASCAVLLTMGAMEAAVLLGVLAVDAAVRLLRRRGGFI
jgi:hypothetical protein